MTTPSSKRRRSPSEPEAPPYASPIEPTHRKFEGLFEGVADSDLVAGAQKGDRAALDSLLRRHIDRVHAVCRRVMANESDAADATQEALIAIVRGLPRFDGRSAFSTWAYRVATNSCLDELRRQKRRPDPMADDDLELASGAAAGIATHAAGIATQLDAVADRVDIDAALAMVAPDFRVAVVLRDLLGLDYAEIGEVLGLPLGTVKSRIARGRAALADYLSSGGGNPSPPSDRPTPRA